MSAPEIACLKNAQVELELRTSTDMLLIVEKGIRVEICHAINQHAKVSNKCMKDYEPRKECSFVMYWEDHNLHGWAISQKLSVDGSEWRKDLFRFDEELLQNYDEDSDKGYILEIDVKYPKGLEKVRSNLSFLPKK